MSSPEPGAAGRRDAVVLALATAALLVPFLGKPSHIDDHVYLLAAQRIREAPLDFYGETTLNWYGFEQPIFRVNQNPPGVSYLLAVLGPLGGIVAMHAGMLLVAVAAVLGVRALARDAGAPPLTAGLLALSTPVFLVSSTTLMSDVPMLALFTWAVVLWLRGLARDRTPLLHAAAALAAAAALTKYFAVALVPLFVFAAVVHRRSVARWLPPVLVVVAVLTAYEIHTRVQYDRGLLTTAFSYATTMGEKLPFADRATQGAVFVGGCVLPLLAFAPFVLTRRTAAVCGAALAALAGFALWRGTIGAWPLQGERPLAAATLASALVYAAAGVLAGWTVLQALRTRRDPATLVLVAWVAGTVVFAAFLNWTMSGRAVLPLVPPLAVLVARELRGSARAHVAAAVPGIVVSLLVAWGDARLAAVTAEAAETVRSHAGVPPERIWFQGHWGFQTAMEAAGARPLGFGTSPVREGDLIVVPHNNTNLKPLDPELTRRLQTFELALGAPAAAMAPAARCGFYSTLWGPLPFALGPAPPERYSVFVATRPFPAAPR